MLSSQVKFSADRQTDRQMDRQTDGRTPVKQYRCMGIKIQREQLDFSI